MTSRDRLRIDGVHPALAAGLEGIFEQMDEAGTPMFVVEGVRTEERQAELFARGRTEPGDIVTFKDGIVHKSNHQAHDDGYGYAVDCAFQDSDPFALTHPWEIFGASAERIGLLWGGRWKLVDRPHVELPEAVIPTP